MFQRVEKNVAAYTPKMMLYLLLPLKDKDNSPGGGRQWICFTSIHTHSSVAVTVGGCQNLDVLMRDLELPRQDVLPSFC